MDWNQRDDKSLTESMLNKNTDKHVSSLDYTKLTHYKNCNFLFIG